MTIVSDKMYDTEAELLKAVMEWIAPLERQGVKTIRIGDAFHKGYSDLFLCVHGQLVVIELKSATGKATPHQKDFIEEVIACGGMGGVARTVQDVELYILLAKHKMKG